jgi:hypothetical protein
LKIPSAPSAASAMKETGLGRPPPPSASDSSAPIWPARARDRTGSRSSSRGADGADANAGFRFGNRTYVRPDEHGVSSVAAALAAMWMCGGKVWPPAYRSPRPSRRRVPRGAFWPKIRCQHRKPSRSGCKDHARRLGLNEQKIALVHGRAVRQRDGVEHQAVRRVDAPVREVELFQGCPPVANE